MWKIKDSVDLEKLGFEYEPILNEFYKIKIDWLNRIHFLRISKTTKEIMFDNPTLLKIVEPRKNKIFKRLCKIGLVEKVEE